MVVLLCVMAAINGVQLWQVRRLVVSGHSDFVSFYAAGKMLRSGEGRQLFDRAAQLNIQQQFSSFVRARQEPFPYIHPPFEALLFVPLSYLPYLPAYGAWFAINLVWLGAIGYLLGNDFPSLGRLPLGLWIIVSFAFFPVMSLFAQGQDDLLFLLLLTLCFLAVRREACFVGGIWLGLATFRPQFAVPLLAILAIGGEWPLLGGFLLTCLGLLLMSAGIFGWHQVMDYPRHLLYSEQATNPNGVLLRAMPNLHGLISGTLPGSMSSAASVAVFAACTAIFWVAIWTWRKQKSRNQELAFSLAVIAALLISYHAFPHDLTLLLLPMVAQADYILRSQSRRSFMAIASLPTIVFLAPPLCYLLVRFNCFHLLALGLLTWLAGSVAWRSSAESG